MVLRPSLLQFSTGERRQVIACGFCMTDGRSVPGRGEPNESPGSSILSHHPPLSEKCVPRFYKLFSTVFPHLGTVFPNCFFRIIANPTSPGQRIHGKSAERRILSGYFFFSGTLSAMSRKIYEIESRNNRDLEFRSDPRFRQPKGWCSPGDGRPAAASHIPGTAGERCRFPA